MKNVSAKGEVQNVYSEKRDENAPRTKPYNRDYEKKKKEEEPTVELDSDGFEIIGSKPVKKTNTHHHKRDYDDRPREKRRYDGEKKGRFDGEKKGRFDGDKKGRFDGEKKERKPREEKKEEESETPVEEKPKKVAVEEKPVVVEVKAKKLKDLFA
jgi:hypothetical protein